MLESKNDNWFKKKTNTPQNVIDSNGTVLKVLSMCALTRIKQNGDRYCVQDIKIRSALIITLILGTDLYCVVQRIKSMKHSAPMLLEALSTGGLWLQFVYIILSQNRVKDKDVFKGFDIMNSLDIELEINTSKTYKADKFRTNLIFFLNITTRLASSILYVSVWASVFSLTSVSVYYVKYGSCVFLNMRTAMYIVKIRMLKVRSSAMYKKIFEIRKKLSKSSDISAVEVKLDEYDLKIKQCYIKMCEFCADTNVADGFQVLLTYSNMLMNSIMLIYDVKSLREYNQLYGLNGEYIPYLGLTAALNPTTEICVIVSLLSVLRSISKDFDKIAATVDKEFVDNKALSARTRESWSEFAELMHRNPLVFTAYDFFPLDYSLIVSALATFLTYTVILTQFQ